MAAVDPDLLGTYSMRRLGIRSLRRMALAPVGRRCVLDLGAVQTPERYANGLCIVLPGIEGRSTINDCVVEGLVAGGFDGAIEVFDWPIPDFLSFRNLWRLKRNILQTKKLAGRITDFCMHNTNAPVSLVAHSGGCGIGAFLLRQLPDQTIDRVVFLAAALSRKFPIAPLAAKTNGLWNFSSYWDFPTVGIATGILGTMDGPQALCAGAVGFAEKSDKSIRECPYRFHFARSFNWGGHVGCANSAFVAKHVTPMIRSRTTHVAAGPETTEGSRH